MNGRSSLGEISGSPPPEVSGSVLNPLTVLHGSNSSVSLSTRPRGRFVGKVSLFFNLFTSLILIYLTLSLFAIINCVPGFASAYLFAA